MLKGIIGAASRMRWNTSANHLAIIFAVGAQPPHPLPPPRPPPPSGGGFQSSQISESTESEPGNRADTTRNRAVEVAKVRVVPVAEGRAREVLIVVPRAAHAPRDIEHLFCSGPLFPASTHTGNPGRRCWSSHHTFPHRSTTPSGVSPPGKTPTGVVRRMWLSNVLQRAASNLPR